MAITVAAIRNSNGITYTRITDTSADFASIANSTYFYNKADGLIRYKDNAGTILEIFGAAGGSSGIFGISNALGAYTYYTTPALAYAAASVGQTIEMFADYTSSGSEVLSITKNVNWNGNGHTWTKTTADESAIFYTMYASCNFVMSNLNLIRQNGTNPGGVLVSNLFYGYIGCAGRIIMTGSYFDNQSILGSRTALSLYPSSLEIVGLTAKSTSLGVYIGGGNTITDSTTYGVLGGFISGTANNCYFNGTTDSGLNTQSGTINNCVGVSVSGNGINGGGYIYNSIGRSVSGYGIETSDIRELVNCTGISVSGIGCWLYNTTSKNLVNNTFISSSSYGMRFQAPYCFNTTTISTSNWSFWDTGSNGRIYNANIITAWNNAGGYGIWGNGGLLPNSIINCNFNLANATAPYISNGGTAAVIKMKGNTYEGGAAFAANITQGITNTEDNQGNIYL
jgi:hypothetical protein